MVGGGSRREEASFTVSNTNVFAALESLRKKKKSDKDKGSSKGGKGTSKAAAGGTNAEAEKQVYWAPAPLTVKSWADVDDEDDDDYYATTAPPQAIWGGSGLNTAEEIHKPDVVEVQGMRIMVYHVVVFLADVLLWSNFMNFLLSIVDCKKCFLD